MHNLATSRSSHSHVDAEGRPRSPLDRIACALLENDPAERDSARASLMAVGRISPHLIVDWLDDPEPRLRWEAARVLGALGHGDAAGALIEALSDEDPGVRWIAADALNSLGDAGLRWIFKALIKDPGSPLLREGASHVLRCQEGSLRKIAEPVIAVMTERRAVPERIIVAAFEAMQRLPWNEHE